MKIGNLLCGILLAGILIAGSAAPGRAQLQVRLRPPNVTTYCSPVGSGGASVSTSCPAAAGLTNYLWKIDASCSSPASTVSGVVTVLLPAASVTLKYTLSTEPLGPTT